MPLTNETPRPRPLEKALDLINELQRWADHKRGCSIFLPITNPASDFCDCGYKSAMRNFEMQYRELRAIPGID
jgi:hypothetical protein